MKCPGRTMTAHRALLLILGLFIFDRFWVDGSLPHRHRANANGADLLCKISVCPEQAYRNWPTFPDACQMDACHMGVQATDSVVSSWLLLVCLVGSSFTYSFRRSFLNLMLGALAGWGGGRRCFSSSGSPSSFFWGFCRVDCTTWS